MASTSERGGTAKSSGFRMGILLAVVSDLGRPLGELEYSYLSTVPSVYLGILLAHSKHVVAI